MHYNDNIHHNTISAFIIINISKYIVKSKNEKKSENFLLLFFNLNTPLSTFFQKNFSCSIVPPFIYPQTALFKGGYGGVDLNILVLNINDLQEF